MTKSDGASLIAAERSRQIEAEGYDAAHDDQHGKGEILSVTQDIIAWLDPRESCHPDDVWGLIGRHSRKPDGEMRLLVIAGALIAAEIDRRQRLAARAEESEEVDGTDGEGSGG